MSIRISVTFSSKSGPNFASAGISDLEFDRSLLDNPDAFANEVRNAYALAESAVHAQLGTSPGSPSTGNVASRIADVNPAVSRMTAPPPTPNRSELRPSPSRNGKAVTSGRTLYGWIKDHAAEYPDAMRWFNACGKANRFPGKITEWSDTNAVWAFATFNDQVAAESPAH